MTGLIAKLRAALVQRTDFSEVLTGSWTGASAKELAGRPVYLERDGRIPLGEVFDLRGEPSGHLRFVGNLELAERIGAGLTEGTVVVEGSVGKEAGVGMAGGILDIEGNAGPRAGAALLGSKRGMTGGEIIIRGSADVEAGATMRRGLLVIAGKAGDRTGIGMIAGSVVVFGSSGRDTGLWSKRGSIIALGRITPPPSYGYACTYQPVFLRFLLQRLQTGYGLAVRRRHLAGPYRRYSGDMAESGKGEILAWKQ